MLVDKPLHLVTQHFIDAWGQKWFEGDYIICGLRYEDYVKVVDLIIC
jgi:hypothetical protein